MITKIDSHKIKHQPYRKWNETNYKTKFLINHISINEIKKVKQVRHANHTCQPAKSMKRSMDFIKFNNMELY
jgi:hypothetical protein